MDITKAKEFLEKQGLYDCHYQDSGMIEHIAEQMEMYHTEQLRLGAVNQQHELLKAFVKQIKEDNEFVDDITFQDINKFIVSNCYQREQLPIYYQIKREFITPELKKRFPSIIEWAFEKDWWIDNNIAKENEIEPIKK